MSTSPNLFQPLDFSRAVPLFPLPNCVLFPGAVQPLQIFEPRYRQMLTDTLKDQSAIALGLLKPGWEKDYYSSPPVHEVLCVGKVVAHEQAEDGNFKLLLQGMVRARVVHQQKPAPPRLYRLVTLQPIEDTPLNPAHEPVQRQVLRDLLVKTALKDLTITPSLDVYFDPTIPTARLIDLLAFNLVQDIPSRQKLLEEFDTRKRGELLLQNLMALARQLDPAAPKPTLTPWPPPLSTN
jgi:Lon protease-like protein